jgi:flagellar protein FliL
MANDEDKPDAEAAPGGTGPGIVVWLSVALIAAAGGAAVPFALDVLAGSPKATSGSPRYGEMPAASEMTFLPAGDVTVNLAEGRMNRYLRLKLALHIRKSDQERVRKALETNELLLRNWLLSHLADKELDEIRGKAGQNSLRREIRDYYNTTLFPDGYDRIYDILFEEFNVQ